MLRYTTNNISISFTDGYFYPPFDITTRWTDDNGNQASCGHLCDLEDIFNDIEPGRYCVEVSIENYFLHRTNHLRRIVHIDS